MRILRTVLMILALSALPLTAAAQQTGAVNQVVDRIISQEQAEMNSLRPFSPMVETYIQNLRGDKDLGAVPAGDKYFMGRAVLAKGVELEPGGEFAFSELRRGRYDVLVRLGAREIELSGVEL